MIAALTMTSCTAIFWICICRLNSHASRESRVTRAQYSLMLGGSLAMGFQPVLFGTWPNAVDAVMSTVVLSCLLLGWGKTCARNRRGLPPLASKDGDLFS